MPFVSADCFDLHAGKAECAVAFDRENGLAGFNSGGDRRSHANAHHAPGADIEALSWLVHVDDRASEIEGVGALIHQDGIGPLFDHPLQRAEGGGVIHR